MQTRTFSLVVSFFVLLMSLFTLRLASASTGLHARSRDRFQNIDVHYPGVVMRCAGGTGRCVAHGLLVRARKLN